MTFGQKVRDRRTLLGMTQGELAKKLGVCRDTVMHYEDGAHAPRTKARRQRIAEVLQMPYNELFREDDRVVQRKIGLDWKALKAILVDETTTRATKMKHARLWKTMLRYLLDDAVSLTVEDQREMREVLKLISKLDGIPYDIPKIGTGGGNL